jgi:hypothetical protein
LLLRKINTPPAMGIRLAGKIAIICSEFWISSGTAEQIRRDARSFVKAPQGSDHGNGRWTKLDRP